MGMAMGQDCELLAEVTGWVTETASIPVWSKMTPNITDIKAPSKVCLDAGSDGIAAINTIESIMGINLDTLRPEPCVEDTVLWLSNLLHWPEWRLLRK